MQIDIRTQGFKQLQEAFRIMPREVGEKVLVSGVNAAAKIIRDAAIEAAPRGGNKDRSKASFIYGRLFKNIKFKTLRKRRQDSRAAVVSRGRAFWGDFLNRGTRYIPATRWYARALDANADRALQVMRQQMIKRMNSMAKSAIRRANAGKK